MKRAVFFDRDGVLNEPIVRQGRPFPPASPQDFTLSVGAQVAVSALKARQFLLFVVTNQPDVARGSVSRSSVDAINNQLRLALPQIDEVYVCDHDDADTCDCRKPLPGLLKRAARDHSVDLRHSFLIGDRWRDIDAGAAAQCTTILIDRGYCERRPDHEPDVVVTSIAEAAQAILRLG